MKCPDCESEFDTNIHTPRILIKCGHTLCEGCIKRLLETCSVRCPECKVVQDQQTIHSFPKNLVLLKTVPQPSSVPSVRGGISLCEKHLKRIEAFCVKDKETLCIDCILSDAHKNHEINSVQKAAAEEKKYILNSSYLAESLRDRLTNQTTEIENRQDMLDQQAAKSEKEIIAIFDDIRAIVNERENLLLRQVKDSKDRQATTMVNRLAEVEQQLQSMDSLRTECILIDKEKEFEVLSHSKERHDIVSIACKRFADLQTYSAFVQPKKDEEFKTVANQLCPVKSKLMQPTQAAQNKRTERFGMKQSLTSRSGVQRTASKERERKDGFKFGSIQNSKSLKNQTQSPSACTNIQLSPKKESFSKLSKLKQVGLGSTNNSSGFGTSNQVNSATMTPQQSRNQGGLAKRLQGNSTDSIQDQLKSARSMKFSEKLKGLDEHPQRLDDPVKEWYEQVESPVKIMDLDQDDTTEIQFVEHMMIKDDDSISKIFDPTRNDKNYNPQNVFSVKDQNETVENLLEEMKAYENEQQYDYQDNAKIESEYQKLGLQQSEEPSLNPSMRVGDKYEKIRESLENLKKNLQFEGSQTKKTNSQKNLTELTEYIGGQTTNNTGQQSKGSPSYRGTEQDSRKSRFLTSSVLGDQNQKKKSGSNSQRSANISESKNSASIPTTNAQTMFGAITSQKAKQILTQNHQQHSQNRFYNTTVFSVDLSTDEAYNKKVNKKLSPQTSTAASGSGTAQDFGDYSAKVLLGGLGEKKNQKSNPSLSIANATKQISPNQSQLSSSSKMKMTLKSYEDFKTNFAIGPNSKGKNSQHTSNERQASGREANRLPQKNINNLIAQVKGNAMVLNDTASSKYVSNDAHGRVTMDSLYRPNEEFIYCFSGTHDSKITSIEMFDPFSEKWSLISNVVKPRTKFQAIAIPSQQKILLMGGKHCDGQRAKDIEEFDVASQTVKIMQGVQMGKPISGFAAVVKPGKEEEVVVMGGNNGTVQRRVESLNVKTGKWTRLPDMKSRRDELAAAIGPDGKIYALGGYGGNDNSCLATAERFEVSRNEWQSLPNMKIARRALAAVALPDGIYVIGGYNGKAHLNSVEKYDFSKKEWMDMTPMNIPRCTLTAIASSDCQYIYAMGGFNGEPLDVVERYDVMKDYWERLPSMKTRRFMHASTSIIR